MRFIVHGSGAIGGSLGGLLHRAGHDVVLIARGPHLEALRSQGLTLATPDGVRTYDIPSVGHPSEVDWRKGGTEGPGDIVLLATKSQDTPGALADLSAYALVHTPVVSLQNGVANEPAALRIFAAVYGVCVMFPATHLEPGVVQADCAPVPALLDIGRYPGGVDATAIAIADAFRDAGCASELREDIMAWKYTKLLMNLGNALDGLCADAGDGAVKEELVEQARVEGRAVLEAAGIAYVSDVTDRERRGDLLQLRPVPEGSERNGGSTRQSLVRGTGAVEGDYLNGEIVLLGRLHGVATPVNELLQRLIASHARAGRAPGSITPEDIAARLAAAE